MPNLLQTINSPADLRAVPRHQLPALADELRSFVLNSVAKTGGQYTETLKKVNSFALDHSLEFTADLLPELPREHDTLQAQTEVMRKRAQMLSELASYLDTQARYFAELEALAKGDTSAGTSRSSSVAVTGRRPTNSGIMPNLSKSSVLQLRPLPPVL